jgi:hypothetical protein
MRKITKYFPGVKALSDVDFRLMKGEVQYTERQPSTSFLTYLY